LGCGSLRLPLCNSGKPDEMTVRPEIGDRAKAAKRPPLRDAIRDLFGVRMRVELRNRISQQSGWQV
jgi:hypothetical protein